MGITGTPENIIGIIASYPKRGNYNKKEVRNRYSNPAKMRFSSLTGFPASNHYLEKVEN